MNREKNVNRAVMKKDAMAPPTGSLRLSNLGISQWIILQNFSNTEMRM